MSYTIRRSYMAESDSPQHYSENAANMAIYEDTSELYSKSSRNFSSEQHALSDKLGLSSTPSNSSALKALQDYGTAFSTDVLSSAKQKHNVGKPIKDANNFGNLNLNSVDEEDEFLYGDSNSLPEEPKSVQNNPEASVNRNNTGWSDEDDYYRDSSISQTNQKSKMKNTPVIIKSEKIQPKVPHKILAEESNSGESAKIFSEKKKKANSSQIINPTHSSIKTIEDHNVSHYIKSINVLDNNVPDYSYLPEIPTSGIKSKYHAAAQILKKPTEKHDLRNKLKTLSSNREAFNVDYTVTKKQEYPRIELSNKPIGKRTVVLPKTMCRSEEKELSSNRRILSFENQRHIPKYFQPKELDHIKSYLKDSSRHYDSSTREHAHELRSSVKSPIDISSGRHCSPSFESARVHTQHVSRSPSLESSRIHPRHHSPYTSRHRSPGYKYKYRSPPHVLRHKSPLDDINRSLYEYRSKHTIVRERTRRYSRSPPRRSHERSPQRSHERSPRRSRERSPARHSRERSPARHSRERSPGQHSRERSPARHSCERSPARHSRERSPAYYKRRDRSQSRPRVKSKSPVYHKSRDHSPRAKYFKTTDDKIKKDSHELGISKKHHYSKDGQKSRASSSSSFCSLSFESHSLSSDSLSEGSTRDMRDSKKVEKSNFKRKKNLKLVSPKKEKALDMLAVKSADVIPSKFEEKFELSHNTMNTNSEKQDDSDLFKNLSAEDKEFYNVVNNVFEGAGFVTALISAQQSGIDNMENPIPISKIEDSTTPMSFLNEDVSNTLAVSNQQMPEIPFSQLFPFNPAMHPMPAPYSPVSNYGPLMPSPMLPPHVPPSPYYNPYVMPEMNVDMDYPPPVESKQVHKKRPTTLRSIPVSDNLDVAPAVLNSKPSLFKSEPKPSNLSPEKLRIEAKEKASPKTQLLALKQSKVQESHTKAQENNALLENYKKLKADRHLAQSKVKRMTGDIIEMKKMVDEAYTWNIKSNMDSNDKILYGKCQSILTLSSETLRHYIQEAKRLDEDLKKVKEKLPKELLPEVAKLTTEDCITEPVLPDVPYIIFDSGKNVCSSCNQTFATVAGIMEHLHSTVHKQNTVSENMWKSEFRRKPNDEKKIEKNSPLHPISGIEFMKPTNGFFCTLCREHCIDNIDAEFHLKSPEHLAKFKNHTNDNPLYENKYSIKRYIGQLLAIRAMKEKRKREAEEKEKQIAKRRKEEVAADKKVKEKIKDQQSKEKIIEELEEKDTDNLSSNNQVLSGIKVTLSGDKLQTPESKTKEKPIQKVVYIGKAPNYKAAAKKTRPLPWYKRDAQSEKPDSNKNSSNADIVKKLKEKIASKSSPATASFGDVEKESEIKVTAPLSEIAPPVEKSSVSTTIHSKEISSSSPSVTPSEISSSVKSTTKLTGQSSITLQKHPKASTPKKEIAYTCLTEKDSKNLNNNIENKEFYGPVYKVDAVEISKSKSLNCENDGKVNVKSGLNVKAASSSSSIQTVTKLSKITGVSSLTKKDSVKSDMSKTSIQNTDSTINHSSKNIFYGTASTGHQDISLTNIKLLENPNIADTSGLSSVSQKYVNEQIYKGISSAQKNIPLSKMKLTELPNMSQQPSSLLRDSVNEPIPMDISPTKDFHMEFPDFSKPPPLLLKENITEPVHIFSVSQPPPLIRESINDPTPIEFLNVSVPPPPLLINKSTPIDFPSNRDFQIGFPDVSKPPPSFPRDTISEPVPIINFQNFPTQPRKFTEEENDFMILGINKSDFMPLVIPVPPPLTLLHQSSYVRNVARAESPALFPHDVGPGINKVEVSSTSSIEVIQNSTMFLPTKVPSFKKQAPKSNKSNQSNLITISTAKGKFVPESKDLKSEKTPEQSNTEQFDTQVSKVEENEKDKLLQSDTKKLTPAKMENSVKSECVDIKGEVKKQSSESNVEIITSQSMVPGSFDCSISIEKLQKEGKIQKTEPKLDVAAKKIAESEKDILKISCIKQLPSLKIQNNMTSECDEIEQESTGSKMTKLITVLSETSNVSERVVEDLQGENSTKKSDESKYDVCTEKIEGDQTGKLEKSSVEQLIPHELKKNLTEKTPITMKYVRSENTDPGSKIKEPHEAEVEKITPIALDNTLYDEPTNKMEESGELSLQKCDMESPEKNSVGSDCEVNKNEVKAILHDTKMENSACTSKKCVEPKKELAIKKDERQLLCKLYDEPTNEMEVSWEHSLKKCDIGSSQNDSVGSNCEVNKNEVKEELHDTKMENLACTSPNFVKSEKESAMKMASTTKKIPQIEVEMRKSESHSLCKLYDEPNNKMEESEEHSLQKYHLEFLKKDSASSDFEVNKTEVKEVLRDTKMENLACTSLDTVESEKESAMKKDESHSQCKLYDESMNKMEESQKHSSQKYDVESVVKVSEGSDCEVNKSEVKEVLYDTEMESLACTSQNSVASEKELAMEIEFTPQENSQIEDEMRKGKSQSLCKLYDKSANEIEESGEHSLQKCDMESLKKNSVGSDCEFNKNEVKAILHDAETENLTCTFQNSVESEKESATKKDESQSLCKLYDEPMNEMEESQKYSLQKYEMEPLEKDSVDSDCEINKNGVDEVLHDTEMESLACSSPNCVESEKGLAMEMESITEEISLASKKITIAEKVIPHIEVEIKNNEDQSLIDLKNVELISSECPIASKADVNSHKTEGDKLIKSNIMQFVSLEVENMISGCDEINAKLHCSEYENSLVLHSCSESQTNSNKELTCVTCNDSVTSEKDAVTEKKIEEIEKFEGSLITVENLSNCIEFLNKKKSQEKLNSEKLISLEAENNLSSECITFIKNEDTIGNVHKSDVAEINNEQKEPERDISPLSSYRNSAEPECDVDKNAVDNDLFLQGKNQCIKDNDVEEPNMIYDEQQEAVSIETIIPTISKSNECSLGSKKGITIDIDVELLISEKCQDEIFVKEHKVCNSKSISPIKELTSKDLNLSCQSVMASETMPILISENASEHSDAIKHEQSNSYSITLFDPPILQSENLRSTEKINEKLVINNESSMIPQNLCIEHFESVTTNKHTGQSSEQPSTCDISVLKPEFLIKSTLEPSEFSTTKTEDIISKNKIECKISRKVFSFPQESLAEGDYINLIDSLQLSKISDCNKSTAVEYNLSAQACVDGNFTGIPENVSKLDPVSRSNLSENDSTISEQQKSKSKEADSESLTPEVMDCNPSLETGGIDTEAEDRTLLKLTFKSQEQVMEPGTEGTNMMPVLDYQMDCSPVLEKDETDTSLPEEKMKTPMEICCLKSEEEKNQIDYFLSFINDEKIVTEPSKTGKHDGEGSDTDEYNNEIN